MIDLATMVGRETTFGNYWYNLIENLYFHLSKREQDLLELLDKNLKLLCSTMGSTTSYNAEVLSTDGILFRLHRDPSIRSIIPQRTIFLPIQFHCILCTLDDTTDEVIEIIVHCT